MLDYARILDKAHAAAEAAVKGLPDRLACGYAWVTIEGRDPLAAYCRKQIKMREKLRHAGQVGPGLVDRARTYFGGKAHPKGWQFWCPGNAPVQSVEIHEIGARAFRDVLAAYGIPCNLGSRLD